MGEHKLSYSLTYLLIFKLVRRSCHSVDDDGRISFIAA